MEKLIRCSRYEIRPVTNEKRNCDRATLIPTQPQLQFGGGQINLDTYIAKFWHDITNFNGHVKTLIQLLMERDGG